MGARRSRAAAPTMASWRRRAQGLRKKASELSTLCGVDVCFIGVDPQGDLFFWPHDLSQLRRIALRYLDAVGGGGDDPGAPEGMRRKRAVPVAGETAFSRSSPPRKKQAVTRSLATADLGQEREEDHGSNDIFPFAFSSPSPVRVRSPEPIHFGTLIPVPPVASVLSSPAWCCGCPAAVLESDYAGDVGEDLLCSMRSPSPEFLFFLLLHDLESRLVVDGGGEFPGINADALLRHPATMDLLDTAATWMPGGGDATALPAPSLLADPLGLLPAGVDFGFYGNPPPATSDSWDWHGSDVLSFFAGEEAAAAASHMSTSSYASSYPPPSPFFDCFVDPHAWI